MKITLTQLNPIIGNLNYNYEKIKSVILSQLESAPELIVFSELILTGYPPQDLLTYPSFIDSCHTLISQLITDSLTWKNTHILIGTPYQTKEGLINAALIIGEGKLKHIVAKQKLPNYDIFNESRYFVPGTQATVFEFQNEKLGIIICEDAWPIKPERYHHPIYTKDPVADLVSQGATVLINISASPFEQQKHPIRKKVFQTIAKKHHIPTIMVNQIGANDQLIFEGHSLVIRKNGEIYSQLKPFEEDIKSIELSELDKQLITHINHLSDEQLLYEALVLGIQDYAAKTGFSKAVLGLSGGIDSALVAVLATEALGKDNVLGITMPSIHSSKGSVDDSVTLANTLGIELLEIPIKDTVDTFFTTLKPHLSANSITYQGRLNIEENLQPRIRGSILMAISNKENRLLLNTGNKSELAVGYCTLYGDMNGALSVIGDLYKTEVYKLASFINSKQTIIPINTITKEPSAELKPNQKDQDTLPPYDILDNILFQHIEERKTGAEICTSGQNPATVSWVLDAVRKHEYKRFQAPPILKVSRTAFGHGRRLPIAGYWS